MKYTLIIIFLVTTTFAQMSLKLGMPHGKIGGDKLVNITYDVHPLKNYQWFVIQGGIGSLHEGNFFTKDLYGIGEVAVGVDFRFFKYLGIRAFQGAALFTGTPKNLSTPWELPTTVDVGFRSDNYGFYVGFKHYSNGTRDRSNVGINFNTMTVFWNF